METKNTNIFFWIKKGFTLVELIIVITILAILATIAFISFKNYSGNARDGNRITAIKNIETWLNLFQVKTGSYPSPDNISGTGKINDINLTYVWEIWGNISNVIKINKIPKDPLANQNYMYGTSTDKKYYQIANIIEWEEVWYRPFIKNVYADNIEAKVSWNYLWYLKFQSWSDIYIANIPSILFNNTWSIELLNNDTYYILNNKSNLPYDKSGNNTTENTQKINANTLIKEITKFPNATLTWVNITTLTKANFEEIFTGNILESFNMFSWDIYNDENIKENIKNMILWWWALSEPKIFKSCEISGIIVQNWQNITLHKLETINKFDTINTCENNSQIKTCNDGVLSWDEDYQYINCVKWEINNCTANWSYLYNSHTYSIPAISHWDWINIFSNNISENNGIFKYSVDIECNDGSYINENENSLPTLQSCNENYHTEDNQTCISNTKQVACTQSWAPINASYTLTNVDINWNGTSWSPPGNCAWTCNSAWTKEWNECRDKTAPTITNITSSNVSCNVLRFSINGANDLIWLHSAPYSFDGWNTWQAGNTKDFSGSNYTLNANQIRVRDNAGNIYIHVSSVTAESNCNWYAWGTSNWGANIKAWWDTKSNWDIYIWWSLSCPLYKFRKVWNFTFWWTSSCDAYRATTTNSSYSLDCGSTWVPLPSTWCSYANNIINNNNTNNWNWYLSINNWWHWWYWCTNSIQTISNWVLCLPNWGGNHSAWYNWFMWQ